jgi:hypothetical protein
MSIRVGCMVVSKQTKKGFIQGVPFWFMHRPAAARKRDVDENGTR